MKKRTLVDKGIQYLTDEDYRFLLNAGLGKYKSMPDGEYLKKKFKASMGKDLDLEQPQTFNEKLQWLKLHDRRPEYTVMVDKYRVREYIARQLGEEYLIPLLGVWDDPDQIDFDTLPNQFVLKCNHNSGYGMCICKDKSRLDIKKVREDLRKGLKQDYFSEHREWPYKDVPRRIIAEKYMVDDSGDELRDYKIHNFNGVPRLILVCKDRFKETGLTEDFFSASWEHLDIRRPDHPNARVRDDKPVALQEMLRMSEKLSRGIAFLRSDFYIINGKIYFGELTFYPASGFGKFLPDSVDYELGKLLQLPGDGVHL